MVALSSRGSVANAAMRDDAAQPWRRRPKFRRSGVPVMTGMAEDTIITRPPVLDCAATLSNAAPSDG
jgi:hypothetical protein